MLRLKSLRYLSISAECFVVSLGVKDDRRCSYSLFVFSSMAVSSEGIFLKLIIALKRFKACFLGMIQGTSTLMRVY